MPSISQKSLSLRGPQLEKGMRQAKNSADAFPVVASLPYFSEGERRRPEIHLLFAGQGCEGVPAIAVFHNLRSRFPITSVIKCELFVYPNLKERLKNCQNDQDIFLEREHPTPDEIILSVDLQDTQNIYRPVKYINGNSQSDGFFSKIMPSSFNQLFHSIPCT